jgi:hypothetical protein
LAAVLLALLALPALAALPTAEKVAAALAERNREAGRAQGLRIAVELYFEDDLEPAAKGTLYAYLDGRSALELVSPKGFVERHFRIGPRVRAARDGEPVEPVRPFLPPLVLIQQSAAGKLEAQLRGLGADPARVVLGYEGEHDCWVLGGREPGTASLWIDVRSHEPVRFDRADGVRWTLGPTIAFGETRLPGFFETHDPEHGVARLAVRAVESGDLPDLGPDWLLARPAERAR